ncbi:MAG: hypothetical protein ACOYMF_17945 [Bacteroidales bacterium]
MKTLFLIPLLLSLLLMACTCGDSKKGTHIPAIKQAVKQTIPVKKAVILDLIPYNDLPIELKAYVYRHLVKIYPHISLQHSRALPPSAYYPARRRYRADTILHQLSDKTLAGHVAIALTSRDISTTNGKFADWGIMGLSYCPGKACMASTFRLNKENLYDQYFKIVIHELGHTQGLPHCPVKTCFMRDAEGGNHTNEETDFCPKCKKVLVKAGWQI